MDNNLSKPKPSNKKQRQKFEKSLYKNIKNCFKSKEKRKRNPRTLKTKGGERYIKQKKELPIKRDWKRRKPGVAFLYSLLFILPVVYLSYSPDSNPVNSLYDYNRTICDIQPLQLHPMYL